MQGPPSEHHGFSAAMRSVDTCIERFPKGCTEYAEAYQPLLHAIEHLPYEASIVGDSNSYQVNLNLDEKLFEWFCSNAYKCSRFPKLDIPIEVSRAVGRDADLL